MELVTIVERLVPDVEWIGDVTNDASKQTLMETYYSPSGQPFPTNAEGLAAWQEILAERAAEAAEAEQMADLEKAETWLTNKITPMTSLSVDDRVRLLTILMRMFKYLKYGK